MIINDLLCKRCERIERDVHHVSGRIPPCPFCRDCRTTIWDHGHAPYTDVGEPVYNHGTGQYHRSHREAERYMRKRGWDGGIGDKVGGAREHTMLEDRAYSYVGQASRASSAERASDRAMNLGQKHAAARRRQNAAL
jgi:hypothetical protein